MKSIRHRSPWAAATLVVLFAAMLYLSRAGHTPNGQPPLRSLTPSNLAELPGAFNAASGRTRVLLLLSPT